MTRTLEQAQALLKWTVSGLDNYVREKQDPRGANARTTEKRRRAQLDQLVQGLSALGTVMGYLEACGCVEEYLQGLQLRIASARAYRKGRGARALRKAPGVACAPERARALRKARDQAAKYARDQADFYTQLWADDKEPAQAGPGGLDTDVSDLI